MAKTNVATQPRNRRVTPSPTAIAAAAATAAVAALTAAQPAPPTTMALAPVVPTAAPVGSPIPCPILQGIGQAAYTASVLTGQHQTVGAPQCQVPRAGTARHVAYTVISQLAGSPLPVVLAALRVAEMQWHLNATRAVKGVAPAGWLRTLMCKVA